MTKPKPKPKNKKEAARDVKEKPQYAPNHWTRYGTPSFYALLNLENSEKAKMGFIRSIESIIRTSFEYSSYIKYLKTEAHLTTCSILKNIPPEMLKELTLEMHHFPFTLYDITETVLNRYLYNEDDFSRLSIANEVMDLHYMNMIGLVPLSLTTHQLAHSNSIIIDFDHIFGDYQKFVDNYKLFISDEAINRFAVYRSKSKDKNLIDETNRYTLAINPKILLVGDSTDSKDENDEPPQQYNNSINEDEF